MNLVQALQINAATRLGIVGAGGKTTLMFRLARDYPGTVILSSSTHLSEKQLRLADIAFIIQNIDELDQALANELQQVILFIGPVQGDGKAKGLSAGFLTYIKDKADRLRLPMIIEADGSRMLPLKAPAKHEPVLLDWMTSVAVVMGLSGLHHPLTSEWVHRPEIFAELSGLEMGADINQDALMRVMTHPDGGLKSIPIGAKKIAVLNQCDTPVLITEARRMVDELLRVYDSVVLSRLNIPEEPVIAVFNK